MKINYFFLLLLIVASCDHFNVKKTTPDAILKEELETFNWNEVDVYPTFSSCDGSTTKADKKRCFETTLSSYIIEQLQQEQLIVSQDINDTISIAFEINESGQLSVSDIKVDDFTLQQIPSITDRIYEALYQLPKIYPAIKRGQQVKTAFKLPIVINVN